MHEYALRALNLQLNQWIMSGFTSRSVVVLAAPECMNVKKVVAVKREQISKSLLPCMDEGGIFTSAEAKP